MFRDRSVRPRKLKPAQVGNILASFENNVKIVHTRGVTDRAPHGLPRLPTAGDWDGDGADQRAGGGVEPELERAAASGARHAGVDGSETGREVYAFIQS